MFTLIVICILCSCYRIFKCSSNEGMLSMMRGMYFYVSNLHVILTTGVYTV